jgi:hypothetical protein
MDHFHVNVYIFLPQLAPVCQAATQLHETIGRVHRWKEYENDHFIQGQSRAGVTSERAEGGVSIET